MPHTEGDSNKLAVAERSGALRRAQRPGGSSRRSATGLRCRGTGPHTAVEYPALIGPARQRERDGDVVLEAFQLTEDERAMRPRAAERHVQMVAPRLRLEAAFARRARRAVRSHQLRTTEGLCSKRPLSNRSAVAARRLPNGLRSSLPCVPFWPDRLAGQCVEGVSVDRRAGRSGDVMRPIPKACRRWLGKSARSGPGVRCDRPRNVVLRRRAIDAAGVVRTV